MQLWREDADYHEPPPRMPRSQPRRRNNLRTATSTKKLVQERYTKFPPPSEGIALMHIRTALNHLETLLSDGRVWWCREDDIEDRSDFSTGDIGP